MFARTVGVLTMALTSGGCLGLLGHGLGRRASTVRLRNQTASTSFCRVEVGGKGPGSDYAQVSIAPGQTGEPSFLQGKTDKTDKTDKTRICVYACQQARAFDGTDSKLVGCGDLERDAPQVTEIVVYDGPAAEGANTAHAQKVVWENNLNPVFTTYKNQPWLTPYGLPREGAFHAAVEHPGVCPKTVVMQTEDRKALKNKLTTDPKMTDSLLTNYPPVFLSFGVDRAQRDLHRVWDLPAGVYRFRVKDDCSGLELVEQRFAEGAKARPAPLEGSNPRPPR